MKFSYSKMGGEKVFVPAVSPGIVKLFTPANGDEYTKCY